MGPLFARNVDKKTFFSKPLPYLMSELSFDLKIASLGLLLVSFLVEIWSGKSLIWIFLGPTFFLAALETVKLSISKHFH